MFHYIRLGDLKGGAFLAQWHNLNKIVSDLLLDATYQIVKALDLVNSGKNSFVFCFPI